MLRVFLIHVYLPPSIPQIKKQNYLKCNVLSTRKSLVAWFESNIHIQIPLTGYIGLILSSTAVATVSQSTFEGTMRAIWHYYDKG